MLMTAGLGTRLRPFTELLPKPLLPVLGVPMAQFAVDLLVNAGVRSVVANVHHLPGKAVSGLQALEWGGARLQISDESRLLLGSAGGLRQALPMLDERPFFLLNADVLGAVDLQALAHRHQNLRRQRGVKLTMALLPLPPTDVKYSSLSISESGLITGWNPPATQSGALYVGAAIIEPEAISHLPAGEPSEFVPQILKPAIAQNQAGYFLMNGLWFDIGDPQAWLETHLSLIDALETGDLPQLWRKRIERVSRRIGPRFWASHRTELSQRARLREVVGPAYWDSRGESQDACSTLGPRAVCYGGIPAPGLSSAILFT
jgi:NDP-sugar pyrophosphorylase family protein